jgi:hypothetical protein
MMTNLYDLMLRVLRLKPDHVCRLSRNRILVRFQDLNHLIYGRRFGNWMFQSSGERNKATTLVGLLDLTPAQCLRLAVSKEPNTVGLFISPDHGNRSNFRNIVFSSI